MYLCYPASHVELSSCVRSGRMLVLHGQPVGATANLSGRPYRDLARGGRHGSSRACAIGRIPRFIAMYARGYFRKIGAAIAKRTVISVNNDDRAAVGPERRITPSANPSYGL